MNVCLLAIESSCDDTSAAVLVDGKVMSNITATQKIHRKYGGVVPEAASRKHLQNIVPVVSEALEIAGKKSNDLHAVAFTQGPGLIGSLMVGATFAKGLALSHSIPLISVNHMQAHVLAHFIDNPKPPFPFICLTVSGGHTQIVLVKTPLEMEIVGKTLDDAAGEAFDKSAKLLGLPYPGGPLIDKYAREGNPMAFEFPEPDVKGLDFSFSGVKTAFLYFLKEHLSSNPDFVANNLFDLCASIQYRIVSILLKKLGKACKQYKIKDVAIAGGVSANSALREAFKQMGEINLWRTYIPKFEYCTDNAAMIAMAGYFKYLEGDFAGHETGPAARLHF